MASAAPAPILTGAAHHSGYAARDVRAGEPVRRTAVPRRVPAGARAGGLQPHLSRQAGARQLLRPERFHVQLAEVGLRLRDVDCDFRLMRRCVFDKVRLTRSSGVICVELMKKVQDHGFRIAQVPVHHFHRSYGKSQFFNVPRVARTLADLARLWWELAFLRLHLKPGTEHSAPGSGGAR